MASTVSNSAFDVDKLTFEIFSILENKFLFGENKPSYHHRLHPQNNVTAAKHVADHGKVRILSIDGGGATNGILAAKSLSHLESAIRRKSGNPNASVSDYFDVVAGSGAGGVLAVLLFTRGKDGRPLFTADSALHFLIKNHNKLSHHHRPSRSVLPRIFRRGKLEKLLRSTFGECTLKDTVKSVLVPCYDLSSHGPFVFSRADAVEVDGFDFKISDVCLATSADPMLLHGAVEMKSVDKRTKILAVDGGIAMSNPTAAAITHVLNNKREFPLCNGIEDLLVVSLGGGESDFGSHNLSSSHARFIRIAEEGASDTVDQAVSMAFGQCRTSNYVRIQGNGNGIKQVGKGKKGEIIRLVEEMLEEKNVESVLFRGKRVGEGTNLEKLETFAGELVKEHEKRKTSILPTVVLKQASPSPRTSSATTLSTSSSC